MQSVAEGNRAPISQAKGQSANHSAVRALFFVFRRVVRPFFQSQTSKGVLALFVCRKHRKGVKKTMSMDQLADLISKISDIVWNSVLLYLLVGTGIIFTIRTRFVQVRKFGAGW